LEIKLQLKRVALDDVLAPWISGSSLNWLEEEAETEREGGKKL
jgi:hypothetical protein